MSRFEQPDDNGLSFYAPLVNSLILARGTGNPSFARATTAYQTDHTATLNQVLSGEARFQGARRVVNGLNGSLVSAANSESLTSGWTNISSGTVAVTACPDALPAGVVAAGRLTGSATNLPMWGVGFNGSTGPRSLRVSFYAKSVSGGTTIGVFKNSLNESINITPTWARYACSIFTSPVGGTQFGFLLVNNQVVDVTGVLFEEVTSQSNQNPASYVSNGVIAAPYHGANVDGVKYFDTTNGNTVTNNVVTEARGQDIGYSRNQTMYLGTSSLASTPDAAANRVTGDIDIRVYAALAAWVPASINTLVAKYVGTPNNAYWFYIDTAGKPTLTFSLDGTTAQGTASTAATGFTNGTAHWVRVTRVAATGTVTYYTSDDGYTWAQLGATVAPPAGNILGSNSTVGVGQTTGGAFYATGLIYRAQIYNGISGTLAVDFYPNDWASGTTWVSENTRETWTLQGSAQIQNSPLLGYLAEETRTNLCLQSDDFTVVGQWPVTNVTVGGSVICPDGITRATNKLLLTAAAGVAHNVLQGFAKAASALAYAYTIYAKAAEYTFLALRVDDGGANGAHCSFNLATGAVSTAATGDGVAFTALSSKITPCVNGWYRCEFDFTTNTGTNVRVVPTVQDIDGNPFSYTFTATLNSGLYLWRSQLEQAIFATSPIPTTTVAVTRNADQLTYPTAGNMNNSFGGCYAEFTFATTVSGTDVLSTYTGLTGILLNLPTNNIGMYDGTSRTVTGLSIPTTSTVTPIGVTTVWGGTACNAYYNGIKGVAQPFGGTMNFGPTLFVMHRSGVANIPNGTIRFAKVWSRPLQDIDGISNTR